MEKDEQFKVLAGIEFEEPIVESIYTQNGQIRFYWRNKAGSLDSRYRNYDSHDALQRILGGFSTDELLAYIHALKDVLKCGVGGEWDIIWMLMATPAQKREAILKATGNWEGE